MGLLDMFKKKSKDDADVSLPPDAKGLDDLPPIPQLPDDNSDPAPPPVDSGTPDALPQDSVELPPLDEPGSLEEKLEDPASPPDISPSDSSMPDPGLVVPQPDEADEAPSEPPSVDSSNESSDLTADPELKTASSIEEAIESATQEEQEEQEEVQEPSQPESFEELPDFDHPSDSSQTDMAADPEETTESPSFTSVTEDDEQQAQIRTESLLLKSIFVEREHYASIIFSIRRVRDDLQNTAPQQRKLSHIDMKLAKEYGKASAIFEGLNENLMIVEHILAKEQF